MPTVTLNNARQFECQPEQTLLDAAHQQGLALEYSCRTGRCGVCKARVLSGETHALQAEEALSPTEHADRYILTCCRTAVSDVSLDIEDLGELATVQTQTLPCRIDTVQSLSPDVVEVTLRTPPTSKLHYLPGQYVDMIGKNGLRRSYSIANAPRDDGRISLQIRRVENGQMSKYWFDEAGINDLLRLEGPLGTFCLRKNDKPQLLLLATGTGIAPIKSILEQLACTADTLEYSSIHLYWGGRTEQDIYWQPDFPTLPLHFTPVLSRADEDWQGRKGYVQQAVLEDGFPLTEATVYACGAIEMIQSAHEQLITVGLDERHFYSDAFVSSN